MSAGTVSTFTNPVLPGFNPDPSICRVGDTFYLVVSSFEYFPGIPIYTSTDLVNWTQIGHVLDRPSQLDLSNAPASGGIFAPTIRYDDGTFYVTATNVSAGGHFIVNSTDPAGPWSEPVWVAQNGIDPSLFFEDGLAYFTSNVEPDPSGPHLVVPDFRRGIQQSLVNPRTGALETAPTFIWEGTGGRYPEGPHLFRRDDFYYLVISEGGTEYGHMVTVGRSASPWGPFEASPHGPMVSHSSISSPFQAVGHADLVVLPNDEWWMVCLGVRPVGQWPRHNLGRETLLSAVTWTDDGWPRVGTRADVAQVHPNPALPLGPVAPSLLHDNFDGPGLSPDWQFVRSDRPRERLSDRPGFLSLYADAPLKGNRFPSFIGRRQQHYAFTARTRLEFRPQTGTEAGIAVRMNESHFFTLGLRHGQDANELVVRQVIGTLDVSTVIGHTDAVDLVLAVSGDADTYTFSAEDRSGNVWTSQSLESRFLSTEFAGGYTGVFVGMYASRDDDALTAGPPNGTAISAAPACFDWFDYAPLADASTQITSPGRDEEHHERNES